MYNEVELSEYEKEFEKLKKELSQAHKKEILDSLYSFGVIAYEYYNNKEKKDSKNGKEKK